MGQPHLLTTRKTLVLTTVAKQNRTSSKSVILPIMYSINSISYLISTFDIGSRWRHLLYVGYFIPQ